MTRITLSRLLRPLCAAALAAGLALLNPAGTLATPPISGNTLDFGSSVDVGASTALVDSVAVGDLDGDGDLDVVSGSGSDENFEVIAWQNDGGPFDGGWTETDVGASLATVRTVALGDLDGDGHLDIVSGSGSAEDFEVIAWQNLGGSAGLAPSKTFSGESIPDGVEDGVFKVTFSHNGLAGEQVLELASLNLLFMRPGCGITLTSVQANALVDILKVRLDDGDGIFETSDDAPVVQVGTLSLIGGVHTINFTDGEASVQIPHGASNTYWISLLTTADASSQVPSGLCLSFDPDADLLVQAKGNPDYSVSIQDTPLLRALASGYQIYLPVVLRQ